MLFVVPWNCFDSNCIASTKTLFVAFQLFLRYINRYGDFYELYKKSSRYISKSRFKLQKDCAFTVKMT